MNKPVFHKTQIIATVMIVLLVLLSIGAILYRNHAPTDAMTAQVSVDGSDLLRIDLTEKAVSYEISLAEQTGIGMTLEVKDHAVRVLHSDCPDQICIRAGWLSKDMDIAVCMPNRVSIVVSTASEAGNLRTGG